MKTTHLAYYWQKYDIVSIKVSCANSYIGILHDYFMWPEENTMACQITDRKIMWSVQIPHWTKRFFPIEESEYSLSYIDKNITLFYRVRRIQVCWRRYIKRRNAAILLIQRKYRICISLPSHPMCQARLLYEFNHMIENGSILSPD